MKNVEKYKQNLKNLNTARLGALGEYLAEHIIGRTLVRGNGWDFQPEVGGGLGVDVKTTAKHINEKRPNKPEPAGSFDNGKEIRFSVVLYSESVAAFFDDGEIRVFTYDEFKELTDKRYKTTWKAKSPALEYGLYPKVHIKMLKFLVDNGITIADDYRKLKHKRANERDALLTKLSEKMKKEFDWNPTTKHLDWCLKVSLCIQTPPELSPRNIYEREHARDLGLITAEECAKSIEKSRKNLGSDKNSS